MTLLFFEIIFAPIVIAMLVGPQLIAGIYARQTGRSFKFWFWISFLIPFISLFILLSLPDKQEESRAEA